MVLNGQTVGGLTVYCVDELTTCYQTAGRYGLDQSFKTTVSDNEWSDSRRVHYVCIHNMISNCRQLWFRSIIQIHHG